MIVVALKATREFGVLSDLFVTCACLQDESADASLQGIVWDAVAVAAVAEPPRTAVALSTSALPCLCRAALGRGTAPEVRVVALHALAGCAGAEALGPRGEPGSAILSPQVRHLCMPTFVAADVVPKV